jgi:dihydroflavonol-4-reductase
MARKRMYFSAEKAIKELGLPQTSAETALKDAVAWFTARGYAQAKRNGRSAA